MDKQQIFDTVAKHLIEQGEPARNNRHYNNSYGQCFYRKTTHDGKVLKCAVGCLIPDEMYSEGMEISGGVLNLIRDAVENKFELPEYFPRHDIFLRDLQKIHDETTDTGFMTEVTSGLQRLAVRHDLDASVLEMETA